MIFNKNMIIDEKDKYYFYENDSFKIYWQGTVFILGKGEGSDSIKEFLRILDGKKSVSTSTSVLKGHFFIALFDKRQEKYYFFVDNGGIFQAYYNDDMVSTDLLCYDESDFDELGVIEFMNLGSTFFDKTLFKGIAKIPGNKILIFDNLLGGGRLSIIDKADYSDITDYRDYEYFFYFFDKLKESLRSKKLCLDITGGIDSRLVLALMYSSDCNCFCAISGVEGIKDIDIAKQVADFFAIELLITYHGIEGIENDLELFFDYSEGVCDIVRLHRGFLHNLNRIKKGTDIVISGSGGELFKDFWWLQDFPFYNSKHIDFKKLIKYRILPIKVPDFYFTDKYRKLNAQFSSNLEYDLKKYYIMETNT